MIPGPFRFLTVLAAALACASCSTEAPGPTAPDGGGGGGGGGGGAASNAALSTLATSAGALVPAFDPDVTAYSIAVDSATSQLTVTAGVSEGHPTLLVGGPGLAGGGVFVAPGSPSPPLSLSAGDNAVTVDVTSEDATASRTYSITATRAPAPSPCPVVDRGSPTDGVTTVTVVQPAAPCNDGPLWNGWNCLVVRSAANNNGVLYTIEVRWNRVNQPVRGSFTWVTGNDSSTHWREGQNLSPGVQDSLDVVDQVRSIDLAWTGTGTATVPRNGFRNLSSTYADVVEYLVSAGIATGVLGHFGNSGGSMMGMHALTNHRMHEVWDGIVVGGGPFWVDLEDVCLNQGSNVFQGLNGRQLVDDWTWREVDGARPCEMMGGADPSFDCMSVLGTHAAFDFPNTIVAIVTGDSESAFIHDSALFFYNSITARSQTRDVPVAPHNVLKTPQGADVVLQRIRGVVDAGPGH